VEDKLKETLRQVTAFLKAHGYRHALIGGVTNQYWGRIRITADIDIKVLVPPTEYEACEA